MTIVFAEINSHHRNTVSHDAFRYACDNAKYEYITIIAKARAVILHHAIDNRTVSTTFQPLITAYTGYDILVRSFDVSIFYATLQSLIAEGAIDVATQLISMAIPTQMISDNTATQVSEMTDGAINGYSDNGVILLKKNSMTEQVTASKAFINRLFHTPTITLSARAVQILIDNIKSIETTQKQHSIK